MKEVSKVAHIIKPQSIEELERLLEQGYIQDRISMQEHFKISKTQFYDYIYKNVSRVKVNKKLREQLKDKYYNGREYEKHEGSNEIVIEILIESAIEEIIKYEYSTLFHYGKINDYLKNNDLLIYELYDSINDKYIKMSKKEISESFLLLSVAFDSAASRKDLQKRIVTEETKNIKTLESRFHIELKKHNHFRITICGKYLYSIIDQIKMLDMNNTFFREA